MIVIKKAVAKDYKIIAAIGNVSVEQAHRGSCSAEELHEYISNHYNDAALIEELANAANDYHILYYNEQPVGFSKIELNAPHLNIEKHEVAKLDRIYILSDYFNLKLGAELMKFNIGFAKQHHQSGIWLFTWVGNERAINFYLKAGFKKIGSHYFQVTPTRSNLNHHMYLELS